MTDFRGHDESEDGRLTGGLKESWDVLGAVDCLTAHGWPRARIALLGFSLGAAAALLAAREARVDCVVAG